MEAVLALLKPAVDYWMLNDRFQDIQGFLDPIEGYALHLLAAYGPGEGEIVEIGSLFGRSTCYLASGSLLNGRGRVHAVDTFLGSPEHQQGQGAVQDTLKNEGSTFKAFLKNLAGHRLDQAVRPVKLSSMEAAGQWDGAPIRLLFIDGDHSYEASKQDFELWTPHLVPNGLVALHDVTIWDGVTTFHQEIVGQGAWKEVLSVGSLRVLSRA